MRGVGPEPISPPTLFSYLCGRARPRVLHFGGAGPTHQSQLCSLLPSSSSGVKSASWPRRSLSPLGMDGSSTLASDVVSECAHEFRRCSMIDWRHSNAFKCVHLTFARFTMSDGLVRIAVISFLAIVTIATGCVVPTIQTHSAADTARQLVQIHIEAAFSGMLIAVAGCNTDIRTQNE